MEVISETGLEMTGLSVVPPGMERLQAELEPL